MLPCTLRKRWSPYVFTHSCPDFGILQCVRLRWYYTRDEILDLHFRAPLSFFNKIVYALGRNELLSGTHLTGALANRIDGLVHIEEYEPSTISFPIVDRNTLYCRLDVRLEVVHGQESPRWVQVNPTIDPFFCILRQARLQGSFTPICTHRCTQDGLYSPDHDVLRYCYRCKTWFHVDCMALSQATLPTHPSYENDRPAQPELPADLNSDKMMPGHGFTAYEYSLWCRLLNLPIQRRYHEHLYPLSFELVLCFIRSHDRTHGCPQNVHDFILHRMTFALAETLSPQIMSYFGILINMPPATFF